MCSSDLDGAREIASRIIPLHLYGGRDRDFQFLATAVNQCIARVVEVVDGTARARPVRSHRRGVWEECIAAMRDRRDGETIVELAKRRGIKYGTLRKYSLLIVKAGLVNGGGNRD